MDIHSASRDGDLSALQDAIKRGDGVNSMDEVSCMVCGYVQLKVVKVCFC